MSSLITRASAVTRARESSISLVFEASTGTWGAIAFMRSQEGIFFLESSFGQNRPDFNTVFMTAFMRGRYSKRPYQLGQAVDGSIDNCILALFHGLCEARGLKAHGLAQLAYPEQTETYSESDFAEIVAQAQWEGYSVPAEWDAVAIMMLYRALHDAGYWRLRSVIEKILRLPAP